MAAHPDGPGPCATAHPAPSTGCQRAARAPARPAKGRIHCACVRGARAAACALMTRVGGTAPLCPACHSQEQLYGIVVPPARQVRCGRGGTGNGTGRVSRSPRPVSGCPSNAGPSGDGPSLHHGHGAGHVPNAHAAPDSACERGCAERRREACPVARVGRGPSEASGAQGRTPQWRFGRHVWDGR